MMLSSIPEYLQFGIAVGANRYDAALIALKGILDKGYDISEEQKSFILSRIGKMHFLLGQVGDAISKFKESIAILPDSFEAKYQFAEFLILDVKDFVTSYAMCDECIRSLTNNPFDASEEDISSLEYIERFAALKVK